MRLKFGRWTCSIAIAFYGAFVLQNRWEWFAVPSLKVGSVSYWQMFGLNMLFQTIRGGPDSFPMLVQHATLADAEKQRVEQTFTEEKLWTEVLLPMALTHAFGLTATLAAGWAIHQFLM